MSKPKYIAVVRIDPTGKKPVHPGDEVPTMPKEMLEAYLERGDIRAASADGADLEKAEARAAEVAAPAPEIADATVSTDPDAADVANWTPAEEQADEPEPAPETPPADGK